MNTSVFRWSTNREKTVFLFSKINNEWFKSCITSYNEQEVVKSVDDKDIIRTFTAMTSRKGHLPCDCL
mgnify:CR=1 FL=1